MKTRPTINKEKEQKSYKTVEEVLETKHNLAKKFLEKIDINKIATLGK